MGKTLSKRSVDITTEGKKNADDEFTEKVEKIEDVDQKDVNGDATIEEKSDLEKKTANEAGENDKDMANEKTIDSLAIDDNEEQIKSSAVVETIAKDDGDTVAEGEEISPLADESIKKSKKEKVKKKWSFRNISFGKKDKQKPTKNDDAAENTTATNGNIDEKVTPTKEVDVLQTEQTANPIDDSSEQAAEKSKTTKTATNEVNEPKAIEKLTEKILKETTAVSAASQNDTASDSKEKTEIVNAVNMEISNINIKQETISSSNCDNETMSKSTVNGTGSGEVGVITETKYQYTTAEAESNKSIPAKLTNEITNTILNGENFQHNGTNSESEFEIEQSKAEIEVNYNSDNIPNVTINCPAPPTNPIPFNEQLQLQDSHNVNSEKNENNEIVDRNEEPSQIMVGKVKQETFSFELSPPPLPESAPPSQVAAFALTVNATELRKEASANNINQEGSEKKDVIIAKDSNVHTSEYQQIGNDFKNTNLDENILDDLNAANETRQVENNIAEGICFNKAEGIDEHLECHSKEENVERIDICSINVINLINNFQLQTSESITPEEVIADKRIGEVQESIKSTQQLVENIIEQNTIASDIKNFEHKNVTNMDTMNNIDIVEISQVKTKENINIGIAETSDQIIIETESCDASDVNINRVNESSSSLLLISRNVNNEGFELSTVLPSDLNEENEKKNDILSQAVIQDAEPNLNSKDFAKLEELKEKVAVTTTDGIKQDLSITCE